jgi:PAS domain S-box-containing protein
LDEARGESARAQGGVSPSRWERRFRCLSEASDAIVWAASPSGRDDEGVRPWAEFTGQSPSEVADEGWAAAIHPAERDEISALWYAAAAERRAFRATYRVRRHDGVYRSLLLHVVPVLDASGEVVEWVGQATDETERLAAEEACRQSEHLLEAARQGAPMFLFAFDTEGRFTVCEGRLLREAGGEPDQLLGRSIFELVADKPDRAEAVRRTLAGETVVWEGEIGGMDLVARLVPDVDEGGGIVGVIGAAVDYTELRHTQAALQASERRFRGLAEGSPDCIFAIDREHCVRFANSSAALLLERTAGVITDELLVDLFDAEATTHMHAALDSVFASGRPEHAENALRTPSGTLWFSTWLVPVRGADGTVVEVFGVSRDVTARKRSEEDIGRLNAELKRAMVTRTRQLNTVTRELEAFAYSASHDLRAPLRAIDGFSAIVGVDAADRLTSEDKEHLERVRAAAQRMGQLIDDILGLSQLARVDLHLETVDLSAMASSVCEELRAEQPGRRVESTVAPGIAVEADPALLRVVLRNLLENAWKFTSHHDHAHVEVLTVGKGDERAIVVRDDGAGFDQGRAGHLFGAFQRLHPAAEFEGDGMGLATVLRLVNRHGGTVWAEGEVEHGAAFYFTLPKTQEPLLGGRVR